MTPRFQEKGGKSREIPARHDLEGFILAYVEAAGIAGEAKDLPLFRASTGVSRTLTANIGSTMSYDTLFITDLHGNLDALRRAVERAEQTARLRYLVLGGDLAPNLVTVRLRDGEFVLRHEARYGPKVADDFRARLRVGRRYRPEDEHGKRPLTHTIDLDTGAVLALGDDDLRELLERPSSFDFLRQRQGEFVASELLPLLRRYHGDGKGVFAMLGNDDFTELELLLLGEERLGTLSYLHGRTCPLGRGGAGLLVRAQ